MYHETIYIYICLFISIYLPISIFVHIYLSIDISMWIHISLSMFVQMYLSISLSLSIYIYIYFTSNVFILLSFIRKLDWKLCYFKFSKLSHVNHIALIKDNVMMCRFRSIAFTLVAERNLYFCLARNLIWPLESPNIFTQSGWPVQFSPNHIS